MIKQSVLSAMLAAAGIFGLSHVPASAAPIPVVQQGMTGQMDANPLATEIMHPVDRNNRNWRWDRKRHGNRCTYRRAGCHYFYRGYYYPRQFWLSAPFIGGTVIIGSSSKYGSRHVRWCLDHYRSYNPRTNTWVTYDGDVRRCVSPYS